MVLVWFLAVIGLAMLIGLAALAVIGASRKQVSESEDAFDLALAAVSRLQTGAWAAIQELRDLDSNQKGAD